MCVCCLRMPKVLQNTPVSRTTLEGYLVDEHLALIFRYVSTTNSSVDLLYIASSAWT